jgi:RNA polymerase sigma factor (sigma-70 family)
MADADLELVLRHARRLAGAEPAEDAHLLEQFVRHRDAAAFAVLVRRHGGLVWCVCRRVLRHAQDVEDAFQATWLALARQAGSVRKPGALASWLHGTAYRIARKARSAAERREACPRVPQRPAADPAHEAAWRELGRLVEDEVSRLPEKYRAVLLLCYWEGTTTEEAACRLGCPVGTVKTRLGKARQLLRERLARRGVTLPAGVLATLLAPAAADAVGSALAAQVAALVVGQAAGAGGASARVLALAKGGLPGTGLSKAKAALALLLLSAVAAGAGALARQAPEAPKAAPGGLKAAAAKGAGRFEAPLPSGAVARLGSVRFWSGSTVGAVAFSPDRKTLASANADRTVRLWEVGTGKEVRVLRGHGSPVAAVAFSPDGKLLASRSGDAAFGDNSIRLWEVATGKEIRRFGATRQAPAPGGMWSHTGSVSWAFWVAFAPDGKTLASGAGDILNRDNVVRLWDVGTGKELRQCRGHRAPVRCFAFAPDGKTLASGSGDQTVRLWEAATGKELHRLRGHRGMVWSVAFSPDGRTLASAAEDRTIRLWEPAGGKERQRLAVREPVKSLAFTDDRTLAWGDDEGVIHLLALATGKELRRLGRHQYGVSHLCRSPDGKLLASVGDGLDYAVHLWDVAGGKQLSPGPAGHQAPVAAVAFAPDGRTLLSAGWDVTLRFWDPAGGKELRRLGGPRVGGRFGYGMFALAVSPDGKLLAVVGNEVRLLETASGKEVRQLRNPGSGSFTSVAFSPDGKTLLTGGNRFKGGWQGTPCLWDVTTGKELREFRGHVNNVKAVAFSPNGKTVASGGEDSTVRLWEVATGKELHTLKGHHTWVESVAFAPDGGTLASGAGRSIRFWDVTTGRQRRKLAVPGGVTSLAFAPDGGTLAAGGYDAGEGPLVRLWEVATGQEVRRWAGHSNVIHTVAFAPDGRTLASGGRDTLILLWDVTGLRAGGRPPRTRLERRELEELWDLLASEDAPRAAQAVWKLASAPGQAVPFLEGRLRPVPAPAPGRIARLIGELDSDAFAVRQRATAELARLGEAAGLSLRKTLEGKPSPEVRLRVGRLLKRLEEAEASREHLRVLRALRALEHGATPEARRLLARLAGGAAEAGLSRRAKAALARLAQREGRHSLK